MSTSGIFVLPCQERKDFRSLPNPQNPWKVRENAQKGKDNPRKEKNKEIEESKERKDRVGVLPRTRLWRFKTRDLGLLVREHWEESRNPLDRSGPKGDIQMVGFIVIACCIQIFALQILFSCDTDLDLQEVNTE